VKKNFTDYKFLLSFISPSGYENAICEKMDLKFYMPFDFPWTIARLLKIINPDKIIFASYDIWPNLILKSKAIGIKTILYSVRIKENSIKKKFIFIGFSAWLLLIPLAITSSDKMVRILKKNWSKLHRLVYIISVFGVLHFIWLSKTIFFKPLIFLIILIILLLFRINFKKFSLS